MREYNLSTSTSTCLIIGHLFTLGAASSLSREVSPELSDENV